MKCQNLLFGLVTIIAISGCSDQRTMSRFRGMWKLDRYESYNPATKRWYPTPGRVDYSGYIIYDGLGHMGVQLIPPGFRTFDAGKNVDSLSNAEAKRILRLQLSSFSYFANCDISKGDTSIEHHKISSNDPAEVGTIVRRNFEFRGDTLILTANELINGLKTRLRWLRL